MGLESGAPKRTRITAHARAGQKAAGRKPTGQKGRHRPRVWNETVERAFFRALENGSSLKDACAIAGVAFPTMQDQRKLGDFDQRVEAAIVGVKSGLLRKLVEKAKDGDWRAAAFYLERRYPEEWGVRNRVQVSGERGGEPVKITLDVDAEIAKALRSSAAGHAAVWEKLNQLAKK